MSPYAFLENIDSEIQAPENGMQSKTLWNDDSGKVVAFGFAAGHELSAHTAPYPVVLYFVKGEAELTLGTEKKIAGTGSLVHMPAKLLHSVKATTPTVMLLLMFKTGLPTA